MKRRGIPPIAPFDLRDHASDERVARIWERIERDLPSPDAAPARGRAGLVTLLAAAACVSFVAGVAVGRAGRTEAAPSPIVPVAAVDVPEPNVFAAGTRHRTFPLPGGGQLSLSPGATVEIERTAGGEITLRLVQGQAEIDTGSDLAGRSVAVVADEARLSFERGSNAKVVRSGDILDVSVSAGGVQVESPVGSRRMERGDREPAVPLRAATAMAPIATANGQRPRGPQAVATAHPTAEPPQGIVAAAPEWRSRLEDPSAPRDEAYRLLQQQPGGVSGAIGAAASAKDLFDIADAAKKAGDHDAAVSAYERVLAAFASDTSRAALAATYLGRIYEKRDPIKAQEYFERSLAMQGPGGPGHELVREEAHCGQMRAAALQKDKKEEAIRLAQEYVSAYPDGSCKKEADRILGGEEAEPDEEPSEPPAPPAKAPEPSGRPAGRAPGGDRTK